ncbi:hypothetical protein HPB50_007405 [Hyalomma asiaticum]|uniref:Uncharacterized protein n=1 Tax=Hyalomma asiaticum TaxID=266040 RepID=A0ACB7RIB9_HYAAI|nr:hypothetical protein HPB50_007405 [Hyalomma asiaticum]
MTRPKPPLSVRKYKGTPEDVPIDKWLQLFDMKASDTSWTYHNRIPEAAGAELAVTEAAAEKMDAETAPAKRRHDDVVAVSQSQRLRQIEASVGVGVKKKARSGARVRASSPSRGDVDANF